MKLKSSKTALLAALLLLIGVAQAEAANVNVGKETEAREAVSPLQGALTGRIVDAEKQVLPGASIYFVDLKRGAVSDENGFFTVNNLKQGTYKVRISYVGYKPKNMDVSISKSKATRLDIILNEGLTLKEVEVKGVFSPQARAMSTQRSNIGVSNVVSSDQMGKFPDANIGDALKRINGINVQYDQGEARFGQVRGTSSDLSSVTVNGNRIPSAEGGTRNVQLDLIPSEMVQSVEVNKVLTSDMDGDAIGGSINLVTRNQPYRQTFSLTAGTGYNWVRQKPSLTLGASWGNRFFNDRFGVLAAISYQNTPSGSYNTEFMYDKDKDGKPYISDYQMRQYYVTRERQSYSLSLDYALNNNHKFTFQGLFNNRNDWENRYRTTLKDLDADGKGTVRVQTKAGTPDNRGARLERQQTLDLNLRGEHIVGPMEADWFVNYASASEKRPNERYLDFQLKKQKFDFDFSNPMHPIATPRDGSRMLLDEDFSLKELTEQQEDIMEKDFKAGVNLKATLQKGTKLKFGAKIVSKSKDKDIDFFEYSPIDEEQFTSGLISGASNKSLSRFMPTNRYQVGTFVDKNTVSHLDLNNPALFTKERVNAELATNFNAKETVSSGYLRIDHRFFNKLQVVAGLRLEHTSLAYTGRTYDDESDTVEPTKREKHNYNNLLPSLLLKWDESESLKFRLSYTRSLSRPKYSALVPSVEIKRQDNELKIGNSNLKATTSDNVDFQTEYYFKNVGLVSFGLFYKHIRGFIVEKVLNNYDYQGTQYTRFTQPVNAGNADLWGFEAAWQRDFSFIATALKCVGLYANYTYTHSRVKNFQVEGRETETDLPLPGSPESTANVSLYFEKRGLQARLSYNYASSFIDEMGAEKFFDRYYDHVNYLDLNMSYTFGKKFKTTVYAEANNLLNQPLRYYQGTRSRTMQQEYYGVKVNAGVRLNF